MYNYSRIKQIETRFGGKWSYVSFGTWRCTDGRVVRRIEPLLPQMYALFINDKPNAETLWTFSFSPSTLGNGVNYRHLHGAVIMSAAFVSDLTQDGGAAIMFSKKAIATAAKACAKAQFFGEINPAGLTRRNFRQALTGDVPLDRVACRTSNIRLLDEENLIGDICIYSSQERGAMLKELFDNLAVTMIPRGCGDWVSPGHYNKRTNQPVAIVDNFSVFSFNAHTSGFRSNRDAEGNLVYTPLNIADLL